MAAGGDDGAETTIHATAVSAGGRALLLTGPSGAGKSALALQMIALGAGLIADDRTRLLRRDGVVMACCPAALLGRIEARGLGLLAVPVAAPAPVAAVVDLGTAEIDRMPPARHLDLLGQKVSLLHRCDAPHFPAALLLWLRGGAVE